MKEQEEEEEEAVISNGMNDDDDTNNINSCKSEFDNNRIGDGNGDDNCNLNQISQVWGTWEELVLTCAVKRHAFTDWDSVAKEVQLRSRSSLIASAVNCRLKYQDLKRRFQDSVDGGERNTEAAAATEDEVGDIPWLEQLRSLRVAELRREVERCDDSILSLQLKVKKLEEEKDGDDGDNKPDLGNDETKPARLNRETRESDRDDNRSMNESNSTASVDKIADHDRLDADKMVQANGNLRNPDPDPVHKAAAEEEEEKTVSKRSEMSHSGELDESGTSTGPGKRKGQKYSRGNGGGGDIKSAGDKSQPLIEIIKLIRSHPRGSVFESRLRSQATKNYKSLIRQHLDIKTIEKKLEKGSYVSSSLSFYRDLKLLFTNAIVFFPTSSSESMAAQELRTLVSNEMKRRTGKSGHSVIKAEAESSVSKPKSSVLPLVACKKKSSASKKTSPSSSFKQKDEKKSQEVSEEKTVTTTTSARSSRRTSKEIAVVAKDTKTERAKSNNKKQKDTKTDSSSEDDDKEEPPKTEKKTVAIASDKKKSVADFLKRIKKNSPQKGKETTSKNQKKSDENIKNENDQQKKSDGNVKKENSKAKPRELRSNSTGKKKAEVETNNKSSSKRKQTKEAAESTGKRGRESGKDSKQPKKRSRRCNRIRGD